MNQREFKLRNIKGQLWDFQEYTNYYGMNPNGLGFVNNNSYIRIIDDYVLTNSFINLQLIGLDVIFLKENAYDKYAEFMDFLAVNTEDELFDLIYIPAYNDEVDRQEYFVNCKIQAVGKSEIDAGLLTVPLTIQKLSNWLLPIEVETEIELDPVNAKKYTYTYPYKYRNSSQGVATISNTAHKKTPLRFEIEGPAEDPLLILSQDGVKIGSSKINISIILGEKIIIDSTPTKQEVTLIRVGGAEEKIYHLQDFTLETFLFAPRGDSDIAYTSGVIDTGSVLIKFNEQFISI